MSGPVQVAYQAYGTQEEGTPIIFLHGVSSCKEHFEEIAENVAEKSQRKVYAIDARNHGDSPWTDEFNFDINVDDLLHFMDNLKIEKATLVGHSMGGITAMKTALKAPSRVDKLIIEDIGTKMLDKKIVDNVAGAVLMAYQGLQNVPPDVPPNIAVRTMLEMFQKNLPDEMKNMIKPETMKKYENIIQVKKNEDGKYALKNNAVAIHRALQDLDNLYSPFEGVHNGPTCVIYGDISDLKVGEEKEGIKKFFPNAQFIEIKDATHDVHTDKPEEFMNALLSVLLKDSPVELAFVEHGPDNDKSPIIFLHGATACREHWDDIPKIISEKVDRKVYVIDARNHGESPWTDEFNFDLNVVDLLHFMDQRNIEKATLVGNSMGGVTSMKTALKAPHRVDKFISEDEGVQKLDLNMVKMMVGSIHMACGVLSQMTDEADAKTIVQTMIQQISDKVPEEVIKRMTKPETLKKYEKTLQVKKTADGGLTFKTNMQVITKAVMDLDNLMAPFEGTYDGNAFFIYGDLSYAKIGEDKENIRKHFPTAEFIEVKGADHDVHTDQPEEFTKALISVLLKD